MTYHKNGATADHLQSGQKHDTMEAYRPPIGGYIDIVENGVMWFRFDARRGLIQIRRSGKQAVIDLSKYV